MRLIGTIAVTDRGWYEFLFRRPDLQEVNFWRPSAKRGFLASDFAPFLFKLRSPHNAICGFGYFARYSRLPVWLAWDVFEQGNGCATLAEMQTRLAAIRERIRYRSGPDSAIIGCTLIVQPIFFPRNAWIRQPDDWPVRTQTDKKYDLASGEGRRVWEACLVIARELGASHGIGETRLVAEPGARYGDPTLVRPRHGQRTFRYHNGRTYYPLHGQSLRVPTAAGDRPDPELLRWHNENVFAA